MVSIRNLALLAVFSTAVIHGVSYTISKEVVEKLPYTAIILFRVLGAGSMFWICGLFIRKQKFIAKKHYWKMILCAMFGTCFNQLFFLKGLQYTEPITASAISVLTPIIVLLFSSILFRRKIPKIRILGVFIGLIGAVILIFYKSSLQQAVGNLEGNIYVFINASIYGFYLVLVKGLLEVYHPIQVVKWLYTLAIPMLLLFAWKDFFSISWSEVPQVIYWKLGYVVVFVTFLNYLFNLIGLIKLKPTTVSVFIYLHPVMASIYALFVGSDTLSFTKISASILIFIGVFLAGKQTTFNKKYQGEINQKDIKFNEN